MSKQLILFAFLFIGTCLQATHNRSGEITYRHIEGLKYEITILTCTRFSVEADRDTLDLNFGDNSPIEKVLRVNGVDGDGNGVPDGQLVGNDIQRNLYVTTHVFPGPGSYILYFEDPNRNEGVQNIPNSVQVGFSVSSLLTIDGISPNSSPVLNNPPKGDACVNKLYLYNSLAADPDGDSLSYELIQSTTFNNQVIPGYLFPDEVEPGADNVMSIDPITGELSWESAQLIGEYNVVIQINEWRNGNLIGFVRRDMQINVLVCSNDPPIIDEEPDICLVAGEVYSMSISASDPNNDVVTLEAFGEPFDLAVSPATFNQPIPGGNGALNWATDCEHIRAEPYTVFLKATDDDPIVQLSNFSDFQIQIIAPPVLNPTAISVGSSIELDWDNNPCENALAYKIYRRIGNSNFQPGDCETGLPESAGYSLIGTVDGWSNSSYVDNEDVPFGNPVCYRVVTCFPDGNESIVSEEFCAMLEMELPVITKVSVEATSLVDGIDTLRWYPPLEIDSLQFTGPYSYEIYRADAFGTPTELIETTSESSVLNVGEIQRIYSGLNTESQANSFMVVFLNDGLPVSTSNQASSIFLEIVPSDNSLQLNWTHDVPWLNSYYQVFRQDDNGQYEFLDSTTLMTFIDTGLVNGQEYCYFVRSIGFYDEPLIPDSLLNHSQENCSRPFDSVPPCPPTLSVEGECEFEDFVLSWNNPNNSCADDVVQYNIYYSPTIDGELELIHTIENPDDTVFFPEDFTNIVGCYAVTALDSLLADSEGILNQNESALSDTICINSCPEYMLPNVISPNGDGQNDFFEPFPGFRYIESIDLTIFNRWGEPIFKTTDPNIRWDGIHQDPLMEYLGPGDYYVPDGTYYYICIVNQLTLNGIDPFTLTGSFTMFREGQKRFE